MLVIVSTDVNSIRVFQPITSRLNRPITFNRPDFITSSTDNYSSLDSEDDYRTDSRNVSHQQQFFSELHSPGRSHYTNWFILVFSFSCSPQSAALYFAYKDTHNPQFLHSLWQGTNARNVNFETLYSGQFTLQTNMLRPNYLVPG